MDDAVRAYVDAVPTEQRPLFDRFHQLVVRAHPGAAVVLSYRMPAYEVGRRRLIVGVWKHGLSLYGWDAERNGGFTDRHPELDNGKGTLRLPTAVAAGISDDELLGVIDGALGD